MVLIDQERRIEIPEGSIEETRLTLKEMAQEVTGKIVDSKSSPVVHLGVLWVTDEVLRNVLHGPGPRVIRLAYNPDGTVDLFTKNGMGESLLTNQCYSDALRGIIGHQGTVMIRRLTGRGNYKKKTRRGIVKTKTHIDPKRIERQLTRWRDRGLPAAS